MFLKFCVMKKSILLLIGISCVFALSQCNTIELSNGGNHDDGTLIDPIDPTTPVDYSLIAFIASGGEEGGLYTMNFLGNDKRKIIDTVGYGKPVRSHCGKQLIFATSKFDTFVGEDNSVNFINPQQGLYFVNTDGTGLTTIERMNEFGYFANADWSPDDTQIVYVKSDYYNGVDLILYNGSTQKQKILTNKAQISSPKFSPDGKQIVYTATVDAGSSIYKIDVNGKNDQIFIKNAGIPVWSPQGDKIAYSASGKERSYQIFVADADGGNQKQLTFTMSSQRWPGDWPIDGNYDPQWTPDGKKIVYVSHENVKPEIFIMNADGSKQTRLTTAEFRDEHPEITLEGKYIIFTSRRSDMMDNGICIMTLEGKNQKVLSKTGIFPVACR